MFDGVVPAARATGCRSGRCACRRVSRTGAWSLTSGTSKNRRRRLPAVRADAEPAARLGQLAARLADAGVPGHAARRRSGRRRRPRSGCASLKIGPQVSGGIVGFFPSFDVVDEVRLRRVRAVLRGRRLLHVLLVRLPARPAAASSPASRPGRRGSRSAVGVLGQEARSGSRCASSLSGSLERSGRWIAPAAGDPGIAVRPADRIGLLAGVVGPVPVEAPFGTLPCMSYRPQALGL